MKTHLQTKEGRAAALQAIEDNFIAELRKAGVELADNAVAMMDYYHATIGLKCNLIRGLKVQFLSDIDFYGKNPMYAKSKNEISFGSTGSFTPSDQACYYRAIHAASILKNWDKACEILEKHLQMRRDLIEQIKKDNEKC
jgi:hypothetical protein